MRVSKDDLLLHSLRLRWTCANRLVAINTVTLCGELVRIEVASSSGIRGLKAHRDCSECAQYRSVRHANHSTVGREGPGAGWSVAR